MPDKLLNIYCFVNFLVLVLYAILSAVFLGSFHFRVSLTNFLTFPILPKLPHVNTSKFLFHGQLCYISLVLGYLFINLDIVNGRRILKGFCINMNQNWAGKFSCQQVQWKIVSKKLEICYKLIFIMCCNFIFITFFPETGKVQHSKFKISFLLHKFSSPQHIFQKKKKKKKNTVTHEQSGHEE